MLRLRALECYAAVELGIAGTELAGAERAGRQLVRLAPLRESGYRYLMQALAAQDNLAEALAGLPAALRHPARPARRLTQPGHPQPLPTPTVGNLTMSAAGRGEVVSLNLNIRVKLYRHPSRARLSAVTAYLDGASPRAFAHRGWHVGELAGLENSMTAFRRAYDEGFRYLETDVHATSATGSWSPSTTCRSARVTDRQGQIAQLAWAQVRQARIGGTEPIPLMSDLLEEFPDARFNIDAKADPAVGPLADLIRRTGTKDRVCLGSFSDRRIASLRAAVGSPGRHLDGSA